MAKGNGSASWDVAIVGGGHNGLTAAAYLAGAGRRVVVLERRPVVGGAAATEEPIAGFRFPGAPSFAPLPRRIVRDLALKRHGLDLLPVPGTVWCPGGEGEESLLLADPPSRAQKEIARHSGADAKSYGELLGLLGRLAGALESRLWKEPPAILAGGGGWDILRLGGRLRLLGRRDLAELMRLPLLSLSDLLHDRFETELLRANLAAGALIGSLAGPMSPSTSTLLLYDFLVGGPARPGPRVMPRGGSGALAEALAAAARSRGAEIRTGAEVDRILVRADAARGVVLRDGEEIAARTVVSNADPRRTFLDLVEPVHLDPEFLDRVRHLRFGGATARVDLALDGLPDFRGLPDRNRERYLAGRVRIAPGLEYLERAFDDAKHGAPSARPFLEISVPSLTDPGLAPAGGQAMSVLAQFAPYALREGNWESRKEAFGDTVVDILTRHAPDLPGRIRGRSIVSPADLERQYGLTEGQIHHGEHCLEQLFVLRPLPECCGYRTPLRNLYLCGAGTHPGGGISGRCGHNAARRILRDSKAGKTG